MEAVEANLVGRGIELYETLRERGYRLILAPKGTISGQDQVEASRLGLRILIKCSKGCDVTERPFGKGKADIYVVSLPPVKLGPIKAIVDLNEWGRSLRSLRQLISSNPRTMFFFTTSPSCPKEVKDPRDLMAFLIEVAGMETERARKAVSGWGWNP